MGSWKTHFGVFLKTEDLQGRPARVVIEGVTLEDVGQDAKKEKKLVATFIGKNKALVLNKTKCEALEHITGTDDYEEWAGTAIMLVPGKTKFGGKVVDCINVEPGNITASARPKPATMREEFEYSSPEPRAVLPAREPGEDDVDPDGPGF